MVTARTALTVLLALTHTAKKGTTFGKYGIKTSAEHIYDETLTDLTVGLEDNTMIFIDLQRAMKHSGISPPGAFLLFDLLKYSV